ncbi:hypothetical protein ACFYUK_18360 [Nonomuraea wenchangensis]
MGRFGRIPGRDECGRTRPAGQKSDQRGRPASVAPFGFRRSDALGGQLVLQVALELPGGGDDVDEQRGRRVVGGEVVEVGQWSGQDVAGCAAAATLANAGRSAQSTSAHPGAAQARGSVVGPIPGGGRYATRVAATSSPNPTDFEGYDPAVTDPDMVIDGIPYAELVDLGAIAKSEGISYEEAIDRFGSQSSNSGDRQT